MENLFEGKKIDSEYERNWSDIDRNIFDQIILLDPRTNIDNDFVGPNAKLFLLPQYREGEIDFLDDSEKVKAALETYNNHRNEYPKILRNITTFPSVADFVDYIENGEDSEFYKTHEQALSDEGEEKVKISPIDEIYNKYYNDIDRDIFDKIIALDPETTDNKIGSAAKNLLLPNYRKGEKDFVDNPQVTKAIALFNNESKTYASDKRNIEQYPSVAAFVDYIITGGESNFMKYLKENTSEFVLLGSTRDYDIIQPLSWEANTWIVQKPYPEASSNTAKLNWCTGYYENDHYWRNYTVNAGNSNIVCFINKAAPTDKLVNYQAQVTPDGKILQFLNGEDRNPIGGGAEHFFTSVLEAHLDWAPVLQKSSIFKSNAIVNSYAELIKNMQGKEYEVKSIKILRDLQSTGIGRNLIESIAIDLPFVPSFAFSGWSNLKKVTFSDKVEKINVQAFFNCISLPRITLPTNLKSIGTEAFAGCTSLSGTVRLPDTLTHVGKDAFRDTNVTLSINKNRTSTITFDASNADWVGRHLKGVTVQENLTEDILDENIPWDLAQAYKTAEAAPRGIQNNPESRHKEIADSIYNRRNVKWDYANATYREISKEEAKDLIKNHRQDVEKLRFLIDGNLVEYELRDGTRLYQSYYISPLPQEVLDANGITNLKNRDSRYITSINTIVNMADKIYWTDEYEHRITPEKEASRQEKKTYKTLRTLRPKEDPAFVQHDPNANLGSRAQEKDYQNRVIYHTAPEVADTGKHKIDPYTAGSSTVAQAQNLQKAKNDAFAHFDAARRALKNLERNRDLYDPEEYEERKVQLEQNLADRKMEYNAAAANLRGWKDKKLIPYIDDIVKEYNEKLIKITDIISDYPNRLHQAEQKLQNLRGVDISDKEYNSLLSVEYNDLRSQRKDLLTDIDKANRELEQSEKLRNDIEEQIRELERRKEELSPEHLLAKINTLEDSFEDINQKMSDEKEKQITNLEDKINNLISDYEQTLKPYLPKNAKIKGITTKAKKEIPDDIAQLVRFDNAERHQ